MNNILMHKGYIGSINFSLEDNCLFGKVTGIDASITYEGNTLDELKEDFTNGIEDYLQYCEEQSIEPQKPFTGMINIKLTPEKHKQAFLVAKNRNMSLNRFLCQAIERELEQIF